MQLSSALGVVRARCLDGRQDVSKEELDPNELLALKGLRDLLPDHPEHRLLDVLRQTQFDLATAADLCFVDNGTQACSPNGHVPSGRPHKPDAQQVPTPEKHPDLFPKENAFVADDFNCAEHQDTLDSQLFQQQVDMQLQRCPELLVQNQGKCRQWWGKQDAHKLRTTPTCGVHTKQADIYRHLTKSPTSPAHSANLGAPSKACLGTEYWPQQGSLNEVAHDLSQVRISTTTAWPQVSQSQQLDDAISNISHSSVPLEQDWLEPPSLHEPAHWQRATVFAGDNYPEDALQKLQYLKQVFCTLPDGLIENNLRETDYDMDRAIDLCFALLSMENGVASGDWSDSSEADTSSVVPDNLEQPDSPQISAAHWPQDDSESLQELDFEQKISKLCHEFPAVHITEVTQLLSASDGSYDGAFAFLLMQMEERDAEAVARKEREAKDLALAQGLQEVESTPAPAPTTMNPTWGPSSKRANPAAQDNDLDWLTSKDPSMQPKLSSLKRMFPQISHAALQNMLVANEGCLNRTVRAVHSQMPETRLPPNRVPEYRPPVIPGRLAHPKTMSSPSLAPPQGAPSPAVPRGAHTSRPATPPPGFALQPAVGAQPARLQRSTGRPRGDNDLYNEARSKFRNAQAQIALCKQEFFSAQRAGDYEKQAFCTSQIEYWQQKAVEEKQRAHKKIFSSKNAEVSNTFKVDLHALHVDEAVAEMEKTIQDLSRFKCTWNVEVVTGKGLHSSVDGPKILPAVRHFLKERSYEFWEVPGMVVFKIHPTVSE